MGVSTITDAEGKFTLAVPGKSGELKVTATLQGFQTRTVNAPVGDADVQIVLRPAFGEQITVGSRAIGAEQEKAVPVDVIKQEQIATSPSTETSQIIQKIAPSFNFPRPTISDGTDSVRPATLRGLGPDQLLVMVNGKRRHASALVNANNTVGRGSSGVDLNAIPASAIDNIEILRDGAAAQYGSDAIAGVINMVLKSDAQPLKVDVKGGSDDARRRPDARHRALRRLEHRPRRALHGRRIPRARRDEPRQSRSARPDRRRRRRTQRRRAAEHALGRFVRARRHAVGQLQPAGHGRQQADLLRVRRMEQSSRLARRQLPPRAAGAELAVRSIRSDFFR